MLTPEEFVLALLAVTEQVSTTVLGISPLQLGIAAGTLQILGYALYIYQSNRRELEPNPAAWLMFAYGTALLTALELDLDAELHLLILPAVCSLLSVYVALLCWKRGTLTWPEDTADRLAFIADIILTIAYIGAWALRAQGSISEEAREFATFAFLLCSNATTFTAFSPLLRDAYLHPNRERSLAWTIWTLAYVTLGVATVWEHGWHSVLLVYPISNAVLHFSVAWLARPHRRRHYSAV
ncbi:MAG TPA: hypothetical protein VNM40_01405 [Candidatus Paceibacterota bacterium]|nr:hypothetical protein [Candidatus Paceibacterota bacterium]